MQIPLLNFTLFLVFASQISFYLFKSASAQIIDSEFQEQPELRIYCTSNQDGTGSCFNTSSGQPFKCILTPGQLIACIDSDATKFECINFGSNQSSQGYFKCTKMPS